MGELKTATYTGTDGKTFEIQYDPDAPCWMCGYPVREASVGGTVICPACDMGRNRFTMENWTWIEYRDAMANFARCTEGGEPVKIYWQEDDE